MTPHKQRAKRIGGCVIVSGNVTYRLKDGTPKQTVVVPRSFAFAEPSLRRLVESTALSWEDVRALGYRVVRTYEEAVAYGLA